jgi:tetratricopeptide (TPR) repeat protein
MIPNGTVEKPMPNPPGIPTPCPAAREDIQMLRLLPLGDNNADLKWTSYLEATTHHCRRFELDARFEVFGVWSGVNQLVEEVYLDLLEIGENAIIDQHDYELYMVLPKYRDRIHPKYLCLTDTAVATEKTRFYPQERAYRLVHGLIGMILQSKRVLRAQDRWVIVVRNFDAAQHLTARFISELARRAAPGREIDVIIQTRRDQSDVLARMPGMRTIQAAPWTAAVIPDTNAARPLIGDFEARTLEDEIAADGSEASLEQKYPPLLEYYRANGDSLAAARLAFKVLQTYNRRGYYHEAKSFIDHILPHFDDLVRGEESRRMNSVSEINSCLVATGDAARALRIVTDLAVPCITKPHLLANMNYILAMHHLRYLEARDIERAEHYILQAVENIRAAKDGSQANEHAFLKAFIDNGLAFLRVRQKRHQEALDLCQSAYESVTSAVGEDRHLLHRSVLQYNMAQVYVMLGRFEEGLRCYRNAISMDPFYTEYLVESGNILQQLGRHQDAIDYYTRAIRYSPPCPEVYFTKAVSHAHQEQWLDALTCSAISLELSPRQPDLHAARAEIFTELGQVDAAIAEYDRAIVLAPDSIAVRVNRAVLHFNGRSYEQALSDMNDVIALDPQEPAHYENRAAIYQAIDRQDLYLHDLGMAERCKEPA